MLKRTSNDNDAELRFVVVTLDSHLAGAAARAEKRLVKEIPGLSLRMHAAAEWGDDDDALERCCADIASGDIIVVTQLFMTDHMQPVLPALRDRREDCNAMVGCMSAAEVVRLTKLGNYRMDAKQGGPLAMLKKLKPKRKDGGVAAGAREMAMLRRLPRILRFIPGTAQDVRAYFLTLQYWLAGSEDNLVNMVRFLVDRYVDLPARGLPKLASTPLPVEYTENGVYHPRMKERIADDVSRLPEPSGECRGTVGLVLMRSYPIAGNAAHYDGVIEALERRQLRVVPVFASGLDARPAMERFFVKDGRATVDAVVSLTGFPLVGGPAYNDADAAQTMLADLDVPYIAAHPVEFQTLDTWQSSERGLVPVEATMMVAIPELEGATNPMVFGGRSESGTEDQARDMSSHRERAETLAARVARLVDLRRSAIAERRLGIVLFNFPPNAGSTGTAAFLSVFESLHNVLRALREEGYTVDVPDTVDELREALLGGNASELGADANVHARISVDDHVRREPWLEDIEAQWGPAPGRQLTDGKSIFVLGARFGNVFVGVQPAFGYEGDPMRLLFEKNFAPTHAFCAFYRYLKDDFGAHAVVHFGTHGALEFMPGKQVGLSADCWPDRLIGDLPNFYLYAANNPSEGALARRRAAATLLSYLTPPITHAGLYRGLAELKSALESWRQLDPDADAAREELAGTIQALAADLELADAEPAWTGDTDQRVHDLSNSLLELEYTLIPSGLHVLGETPSLEQRAELLTEMATSNHELKAEPDLIEAIVKGNGDKAIAALTNEEEREKYEALAATARLLAEDHELPALLRALSGGYVRPAPGGDLLRNPEVLPTGRNLHGFDPYRLPSALAMSEGRRQAMQLLERHREDGHGFPQSIAMVLWATDNLKSEGAPLAQALALMGAEPAFDAYGRLNGVTLVPLQELGRPRVDVLVTMSGIFRDLLPLHARVLAEAAFLAAIADEPEEQNFIRKHALAYQQANDCDIETAALRVFSNADGAYGANVNQLIDAGCWDDEEELGNTFMQRKCFAYDRRGEAGAQPDLLQATLQGVDLAYQNLESVELGVTSISHYFDTLGGINRVAQRRGEAVPVYLGDFTHSNEGRVRTLGEQVALETRTRVLNPKWYEGMLDHGYEGVREIESHVTNTMGWSATTGQVDGWVYQQITETFVLDEEMRRRIAELNPAATARVANRLIEAHERDYWAPDDETLAALRNAGDELEDRLEGIRVGDAA